jgi:hypothetical protein
MAQKVSVVRAGRVGTVMVMSRKRDGNLDNGYYRLSVKNLAN